MMWVRSLYILVVWVRTLYTLVGMDCTHLPYGSEQNTIALKRNVEILSYPKFNKEHNGFFNQ